MDVCIVGAGVSGLATARLLTASRLSVSVLEARRRAGGRLHSVQVDEGWIDLGATWYWPHERRITHLIDELDIDVFPHHLAGDALYDTGGAPQRLDGNPLDVSAGRFAQGAASLASAIASRLPEGTIRLDHAVNSIVRDGDRWTVSTGSVDIACRHVVLALPPALAVATIHFEPHLPAAIRTLAAATPVWMGTTAKAVAVYRRPFWREIGLSGSAISHVGPLREIHDLSGPGGVPAALFGFAPVDGARALDEAAVVAQLVRLFGDAAATPDAIAIADWRCESFTSPADVTPGTDYSTYGHRRYGEAMFDGTVHWAATETGPEQPGHIEGALAASERTVAAILAAVAQDEEITTDADAHT
jgi:monoamine oxidase